MRSVFSPGIYRPICLIRWTLLILFYTALVQMAKYKANASSINPQSKRRHISLDLIWKDDFSSMMATCRRRLRILFMLCRKHSWQHPKRSVAERAVWADISCPAITRQALAKHNQCEIRWYLSPSSGLPQSHLLINRLFCKGHWDTQYRVSRQLKLFWMYSCSVNLLELGMVCSHAQSTCLSVSLYYMLMTWYSGKSI